MKKEDPQPHSLREQAESALREKSTATPAPPPSLTPPNHQRALHELQVHQIELEMQNEQLQQARATTAELLAQYTDLYDFAPAGYLTLDRAGTIRQVNLTFTLLLGVERSRLVGRRMGQFVERAGRHVFSDYLEKVFAGGAKESCDVTLSRDGAAAIVVHLEGTRCVDTQECRVVMMDITERTQLHAALEAETVRRRVLFENSPDGVLIIDPQTAGFLEFNMAAHQQSGYSREEFARLTIHDLEVMESVEATRARIGETIQKGKVDFETMQRTRQGNIRNVHVTAQIVQVRGQPIYYCIWRDITERKQVETIQNFLGQTISGISGEAFFPALARFLAETLRMDFICIDRLEGDGLIARTEVVWCDGQFEDNVTYALKDTPCGDVVGKHVCCFPSKVCQFFPHDQVLQDLRAESYAGTTLFDHAGKPNGLIAVISRNPLANRPLVETSLQMVAVRAAGELERLQAEEALHESELMLRESQHIAGLGSYVLDIPGDAWSSSDVLDEVFGIDDAYERSVAGWAALIHPDDRTMMVNYLHDDVLGRNQLFDKEYRIIRQRDHTERWVQGMGSLECDANGNPVKMSGAIMDITARKHAAEALRQKMEELSASNHELALFNRAMVGRELRMIELKEEINELCRRLREAPRYATDSLETNSAAGAGPPTPSDPSDPLTPSASA